MSILDRVQEAIRQLPQISERWQARLQNSRRLLAAPEPKPVNKPNYRRRHEVFSTLDAIHKEHGYRSISQCQSLLKTATGVSCSRRLVVEWRKERRIKSTRRDAVYASLDAARAEGWRSYTDLRQYVKGETGNACGSRLILDWKRSRGIEVNTRKVHDVEVEVLAHGDSPGDRSYGDGHYGSSSESAAAA